MGYLYLSCVLIAIGLHSVCGQSNCPGFQCVNSSIHDVIVGGQRYKCSEDKLCNQNGVKNCEMCISCQPDVYECSTTPGEENKFTMNGIRLECSGDFICNNEDVPKSCSPCIAKACTNPQNYNCTDDHNVLINGLKLSCDDGKICNKDHISPCTMCIDPVIDDLPATVISSTVVTTTPSTDPTVTTPATKPTVTTTPATVPTPPTEPTVPPTAIIRLPNCNDGYGYRNPCRAGSKDYYFSCRKIKVGFTLDVKPCSNVDDDYKCRDSANIDQTICQ